MIRTFLIILLFSIVIPETFFVILHRGLLFPTKPLPIPKPLHAYSFQNLKKTHFVPTQITLQAKTDERTNSFSQLFTYAVPDKPNSAHFLTVSGLLNAPSRPGTYPVIIMFRGFVPHNIYQPGIGTEPVAKVLADNGYITLAPDFLDYGTSATGSAEAFESRFQSYTTALSLLASLSTLNQGLSASYSGSLQADLSRVGIWGHSNGGHITLATLSISGVSYPTVVWAPVSSSFPYDILYYTDESDDQGKILRKLLAQFETVYNTDDFSPPLYYKWIKAPIQVDQGISDEEVPYWWSQNLVKTLQKLGVTVTLNTYPNADHNLLPDGWSKAVTATVDFYNSYFKK